MVEESKQPKGTSKFTASTGVVFKLRPVSPFIVDAVQRTIPRPRVPKQFVESKGREMENPDSPEYLQAMEDYQRASVEVVERTFIALGARPEYIPESIPQIEDNSWVEDLAFVGLLGAKDPRQRYVDWVKFVAFGTAGDYTGLINAVKSASLTPEAEVNAAVESFRSDAERQPDLGAQPGAPG